MDRRPLLRHERGKLLIRLGVAEALAISVVPLVLAIVLIVCLLCVGGVVLLSVIGG